MLMSAPLIQHAYVTNDLDRAMAMFKTSYGIANFLEMRDLVMNTWPEQTACQHVALAYAGDSPVQIELIQPLSGHMGVYAEPLRDALDFRLVFHHHAHQAATPEVFDAMRAAADCLSHRVVVDGEAPGGVRYFYTDNRSTIGHHIEYVYYPAAVWDWLQGAIPHN